MEKYEQNEHNPGAEEIAEGRGVAAVFGLIPLAAVLGALLLLMTFIAPAPYAGLSFGIGLALALAAGALFVYQSRQRGRGRV